MAELENRRTQTSERLKVLRARLKPAGHIAASKACVYATGSFGRCEASSHSDLDLFIVGKNKKSKTGTTSKLSHLDEICILSELIKLTRELKIKEFSGDGEYLKHYSLYDLTSTLGTRADDVTNTLTARLLLLLESSWLVEKQVYDEIIASVVDAYWKDWEDHKTEFVPAFLANDILRLWRTFCVNYESGTKRFPAHLKAKGKLKNYKLKHSRLLTCYSALLYLLAVYERSHTVSPQDAIHMSSLTPTRRIEWLLERDDLRDAHSALQQVLDQYEMFLDATDAPEKELIKKFQTKEMVNQCAKSASALGDATFRALQIVGNQGRLHRLMVV